MPLYEFLLEAPDRPEEIRISDYNGLCEGDDVTLGNRRWIVVCRVGAPQRADGVPVEARFLLRPREPKEPRGREASTSKITVR